MAMFNGEEKLTENLQMLVAPSVKLRIEVLAESENRHLSEMLRILVMESLIRWEKSAPGRRKK
jgi:hypothetical protein